MSKALDKLVLMHRQKVGQTRRYSSGQDLEKKLDDAFAELAKVLEPISEKEMPINEKEVAEILATGSDELAKDNKEEKSSYRYNILPKIYSNLERIDSSPHLARKLISYYIKNRRREKMYRLYGMRKRHSERVMADHLVHQMYMELGRTLYFSWIQKLYEPVKQLIDSVQKAIESLIQKNLEHYLAILVSGKAGAAVYLLLAHFNIWDSILALRESRADWAVWIFVGVVFLAVVGGSALLIYLIFRLVIAKNPFFLRPKALLTFVKGYNLIKNFNKAFSVLLGDIGVNDLIVILNDFAKAAKGDKPGEKIIKIIKDIVDKINSNKEYAGFFMLNQSQLEKIASAQEQGEAITLRFDARVAGMISKELQEKFNVPQFITVDYFNLTERGTLAQAAEESEGAQSLPTELVLLAILTSPSITVKLSTSKMETTITFKAWNFIKKYSEIQDQDVSNFLKVYMSAFDKKGYNLSQYLRDKFEKRVNREKQN